MNLIDSFHNAGITHAIIVDDAYDEVPSTPLTRDQAQEVINGIGEKFDQLLRELRARVRVDDAEGWDELDDEAFITACLVTLDGTGALYRGKKDFPGAETVFKTYDDQKASRRQEVDKLESKLVKANLTVQRYGAIESIDDSHPPHLLFLDLQMQDTAGGRVDTAAAISAYTRLHKKHEGNPFVFLMSTLSGALPSSAEAFRYAAGIFHSQFESIDKAIFSQDQMFEDLLTSYAVAYLHLGRMRASIDNVVSAINASADSLKQSLLDLDIADYRILQSNTAGIEKMPLGVYVTELSLEYLSYLIESDPRLWNFAAEVDAWRRENIPRSRFALRPSVRDVYMGNVIHAPSRLEQESKLKRGPKDGYFYLGDVFFRTEDCIKGREPRSALIIATPACDLARPDTLKTDRTILLCQGRVTKTKAKEPIPTARSGLPMTLLCHPADSSMKLHIEWNIKKLETWDAAIINRFARGTAVWTRVGRLRPLYALQVQHAITADLSRVGTQRPPSEPVPHGVELLVRTSGKWKSIDAVDASSPLAAAVYRSEDQSRYSFVLSDPTLTRIRQVIASYKVSPDKSVATAAAWLSGLKQLDRKLIYADFDFSGSKGATRQAYPLSLTKRKLKHQQCIAYVDKRIKCPYTGITGGAAEVAGDQQAIFAIRFVALK
ncbi:hypothetical protein [Xanthomonas sp. BRIP62415]|uniref:hypothetical protein n=1 Tax=Xanthomonas sp. BRIP62415 TaxID=2182390 RepID=UPI000F8D3991|nr:hypothetical protein [Xanthomonas sp. BRIP62415]